MKTYTENNSHFSLNLIDGIRPHYVHGARNVCPICFLKYAFLQCANIGVIPGRPCACANSIVINSLIIDLHHSDHKPFLSYFPDSFT